MVVPGGDDCSCHVIDACLVGVFKREYSVLRFLGLWWIDVCGDGTIVQGEISGEGSLYWHRHRRTGDNTMVMPIWDVVSSCRSFSGCRGDYAQIPEVAILGRNGGVCLRLCWGIN